MSTHKKGRAANASHYGSRSLPDFSQTAFVRQSLALSAPTYMCPLTPWAMDDFDAERAWTYARYPTVADLWKALGSVSLS